jgi:hypothetical protein
MRKIVKTEVMQGYQLGLTFDDGVSGVVDLAHLAGKGVFALWLDRDAFERVHIGSSGELAWGDQADLCPDALYLKVTGKRVEEVFPAVTAEMVHA